ncbi:MAG TPA: response regulator [Nevskiaceae bacterium]|nr:response regulator [Nevskiaceae bacterium]
MSDKVALVVDDSKSARYAMRKFLEQYGYAVDTAESAQDAYVYLQRRHPNAIFLDHQMPGCDGLEMLRDLKQGNETRGIPVIVCSADEDAAFVAQVKASGAYAVLAKPPRAERVGALLRELDGSRTPAAPQPTARRTEPRIGLLRRLRPAEDVIRAAAPVAATSSIVAPARPPDEMETRLQRMQEEIASLHRELAARPAVTAETLLPALQKALEPYIQATVRQHSVTAARSAVAEIAERLLHTLHGA